MVPPVEPLLSRLNEDGKFDWAEPDEEVHTFINDLERPGRTYLVGGRMYEVMSYWEAIALADQPPSSATSRRSGGRPPGRASPDHRMRLEELPEPRDVLLGGGLSVVRRRFGPDAVDQPVDRDGLARG